VIRIDERELRGHVRQMVRESVEQTLNDMLEAEADAQCGAKRYERSPERVDARAGHYERKRLTSSGEVTPRVPRLRNLPFETQTIERYRRRESSVEEVLIEMYLAGVSVRGVEDITEAPGGQRVSPSTVSALNQKIDATIEAWRQRPIGGGSIRTCTLRGLWLKRSWGGEVRNVAVLVAVGVGADGYREILGVAEGTKEDQESWRSFLRYLKRRGLKGVKLVIRDTCLRLLEALAEFYPEAQWQRCMVPWYRNVFTVTRRGRRKEVAAMLKAIHGQEEREAARQKAEAVAQKLESMKLAQAAPPPGVFFCAPRARSWSQ
jgi:transposase-like protein